MFRAASSGRGPTIWGIVAESNGDMLDEVGVRHGDARPEALPKQHEAADLLHQLLQLLSAPPQAHSVSLPRVLAAAEQGFTDCKTTHACGKDDY